MTINEAIRFFEDYPKIQSLLKPLTHVGLGYMRLGQPINTLSGGEAQRLKLSRYLNTKNDGNKLFIFDEPTTGLHFEDIKKLLEALQSLVSQGNTILIIEHNMDVIKASDWVIDLGPEGGDDGGRVVAEGSPEKVAGNKTSHTGRFLRQYLTGGGRLKDVKPSLPAIDGFNRYPFMIYWLYLGSCWARMNDGLIIQINTNIL